jgi:DNA processing protein
MEAIERSPHETLAWLRLTLVPGVTPRERRALLEANAGDVHAAAGAIRGEPAPRLLERTLAWLSQPGCNMLTMADAQYPQLLLEIHDPPPVLYARGRLELLALPAVAVVGSRNATPMGLRDAASFANSLSDAGLAIVSGLALGIDAAAHRGGLAGASSSIAVMGTGPDRVYPPDNERLAEELAARGCLLSEFPVGTAPDKRNFPRRNRLISGMSRGVLVVEAAVESGSLITAHAAAEQGRDVFAIPGSIHSALSKGCHKLIKEGAKLVESAADVLEELGIATQPEADEDALMFEAMGFAPFGVDDLVNRTGLSAATLAARLMRLEIEGTVQSVPGSRFQRLK